MARIFISYSRKNIDFARRLAGEIEKHDLDFWVDWEGIPPTVDWMQEIQKGIEEADTFLAIVSQEWITSKVCQDELAIAVKNGKRLIPVVPYDIVWSNVPPALAKFNFIFFTENFEFNAQLDKLFTALDTDYDWLKTHRRLQVKALEWERSNKESGFLLHGKDLEEAEQQISVNAGKDPNPTDIQRDYVLKSRQAAEKQRKRAFSLLLVLIAAMLGVIGLLAQPHVENMIAKAKAQNRSEMILVPAGRIDFQLETSITTVEYSEFYIEKHPVTLDVYNLCVRVEKCPPPVGSASEDNTKGLNDPVNWVTITQAAAYCEWIGRRLPSAPEWESAVHLFSQPADAALFWEWTSSYKVVAVDGLGGEWNGQINTLLMDDWTFLQEVLDRSTPEMPLIITNLGGPFGATDRLGFRCADD